MADPQDVLSPAALGRDRPRPGSGVRGDRPGAAAQPVRRRAGQRRARARQGWFIAARRPPRIVAELGDLPATVEISGPGFLNITFDDAWIASGRRPAADPGSACRPRRRRWSRSTTRRPTWPRRCTSATCAPRWSATRWRACSSTSATVVRQNHIGDWGTPFGMLIEHLLDVGETAEALLLESDPNAFYQAAREKFDGDAEFADRPAQRVVALQAGDQETLRLWACWSSSRGTTSTGSTDARRDADRRRPGGESTYNADLAGICDELEAAGLATVSDGALCVFLDGFTGREGKPLPLIIRKSDGGYGYATTDLATIRHRVDAPRADRCSTSSARRRPCTWRWSGRPPARPAGCPTASVVHVQIGNVLGRTARSVRTRAAARPADGPARGGESTRAARS